MYWHLNHYSTTLITDLFLFHSYRHFPRSVYNNSLRIFFSVIPWPCIFDWFSISRLWSCDPPLLYNCIYSFIFVPSCPVNFLRFCIFDPPLITLFNVLCPGSVLLSPWLHSEMFFSRDPVFSSPDDHLWFTQSLIAADYVIATQIRSLFCSLDNFLESHLIFVTQ